MCNASFMIGYDRRRSELSNAQLDKSPRYDNNIQRYRKALNIHT